MSDLYQEALGELYDIAESEGKDIIVISMDSFNRLSKAWDKLDWYEQQTIIMRVKRGDFDKN